MRLIAIPLKLLLIVSFTETLNADDTKKRSAELQVLDRLFIGTWKSVVTNKTTGEKFNTVEKRRWSDKGKFILSEDVNLSTKKESHFLITYDPNSKKYRCCLILESGALIMQGTWDEETKTMSWSGIDSAGNIPTEKIRLIDKDHIEWFMVIKNPSGKTLVKLAAKQTRSKK